MLVNSSQYGVNVITYEFPTSLPANFTNPANLSFPNTSFNPVFKMTTGTFYKIIGYSSTFATSATAQASRTHLSSTAPILNPNANIVLSLSGIQNEYASPNNIIYSFGVSTARGSQILEKPAQLNFNQFVKGSYKSLTLRILDSITLQPLQILDNEISIMLVIKDKSK